MALGQEGWSSGFICAGWPSTCAAGELDKVINQACPTSSQTQGLDAKAEEIEQLWNPTGYYTADQMRQVVGATMNLANQYHNAVMSAQNKAQAGSFQMKLLDDAEATFTAIGKQALDYTQTWQSSQASGAVINAPGLRNWVINATRAMNKGMRAVEITACTEAWWYGLLASYMALFDTLKNVVTRIVGVVVKAGQIVLDAAETTVGLWPVLKWGLVGSGFLFVGLFVWNKLQRSAQAGQRKFDWGKLNPIPKVRALVKKPEQMQGARRRR